ncbi:unnamed protein product [Miscanthus lutarioriparius]|uniref:Uncharacterized protein n=1 Tax=Miscanthus lutarioriparius TaxID=422564 RepID=A0A811MJQ3_9POAL|nr:unnamed protein product [Miscanthus lutarioriparius]
MAGKEDPTEDSRAVTPADNKAAADAVAAASNVGEAEPPEEELVAMPEDYLRWLLAQTRETDPLKRLQEEIEWLQAEQDEFFQFQAWARDELDKHGRVMVPADEVSPGQFQEAINEYWYGLLEEYDNGGHSKTEVEAAVPSN